jgi:hypothetical protein
MVVLLAITLVAEAGVLQTNGQAATDGMIEVKERYVFYLVPLAGICFALYAKRGWPHRVLHLALAAALVVMSIRVPLSGFAISSTLGASPILYGVFWLTRELDGTASAALTVAVFVGALSAIGVAGSRRPRLGTPLALALALFASAVASAGAVAFDMKNSSSTRSAYLPANPSFVDRVGLGRVVLLQSWGGRRSPSLQQLFWNRSISRVFLLPGASPIDTFGNTKVKVGDDGSLLAGGRTLRSPVLVDGYGSTVRQRGARPVARSRVSTLWEPKPAEAPRLALYAIGRYYDGWLGAFGAVYLWPDSPGGRLTGDIVFNLRAPDTQGKKFTIRFEGPARDVKRVRLGPGERRTIRVRVCAAGSTYVTFRSGLHSFVELRAVSLHSSAPVFVPDAGACPVIVTPVPASHSSGPGPV